MTFLAGFRLYPKAIAWSILLSSTIIMEGYDLTLISSFFSLPSFRQAYGKPTDRDARLGRTHYEISAAWQAGLTNVAVVGEIIGLLMNGYLADRVGYRYTMIAALAWLSVAIFLSFFASSLEMLLVAQLLCGTSPLQYEIIASNVIQESPGASSRHYQLPTQQK